MPDPQSYNESALLQEIAYGSEVAFRQLVIQYTPLLGPYIQQFTRSRERAQELVQDVFVQVWTARETLGRVRDFRSFLFVISRNLALNAVRDLLREKARQETWEADAGHSSEAGQDDYTQARLSLIEAAVEQLAPQQRRAWILTRREGRTYAEAGEAMGLSKETVKKYLQYAHASILQYVEGRLGLILAGILTAALLD